MAATSTGYRAATASNGRLELFPNSEEILDTSSTPYIFIKCPVLVLTCRFFSVFPFFSLWFVCFVLVKKCRFVSGYTRELVR